MSVVVVVVLLFPAADVHVPGAPILWTRSTEDFGCILRVAGLFGGRKLYYCCSGVVAPRARRFLFFAGRLPYFFLPKFECREVVSAKYLSTATCALASVSRRSLQVLL